MQNNEECAMAWNPHADYPGGRITKNMICTLAKDRKGAMDSCHGDSGGRPCLNELIDYRATTFYFFYLFYLQVENYTFLQVASK